MIVLKDIDDGALMHQPSIPQVYFDNESFS